MASRGAGDDRRRLSRRQLAIAAGLHLVVAFALLHNAWASPASSVVGPAIIPAPRYGPGILNGDSLQLVWFVKWTPFAMSQGHDPLLTRSARADRLCLGGHELARGRDRQGHLHCEVACRSSRPVTAETHWRANPAALVRAAGAKNPACLYEDAGHQLTCAPALSTSQAREVHSGRTQALACASKSNEVSQLNG